MSGEMEFGVTVCPDCGEQRWAGTGPCSSCPTPEPSEVAETTAGEREVEALILAALRESWRDDYSPQTVAAGVARAVLTSPWLAARVSAAETKARADERERIAQAMSEEIADRVTWGDGTEYISVADAQRIARSPR